MILDQYGRPLVIYERKAVGFVERTLPAESSEPPTVSSHEGQRVPEWRDYGCECEIQPAFGRRK